MSVNAGYSKGMRSRGCHGLGQIPMKWSVWTRGQEWHEYGVGVYKAGFWAESVRLVTAQYWIMEMRKWWTYLSGTTMSLFQFNAFLHNAKVSVDFDRWRVPFWKKMKADWRQGSLLAKDESKAQGEIGSVALRCVGGKEASVSGKCTMLRSRLYLHKHAIFPSHTNVHISIHTDLLQ